MAYQAQPVAAQAYIVQPYFYSQDPSGQTTVFVDEPQILKAKAIAQEYLGQTGRPVTAPSLKPSKVNYQQGQQAPVTINFVWQPYQPGFFETAGNVLRDMSRNSAQTAQAQTAADAEIAKAKYDKRSRSEKQEDAAEAELQRQARNAKIGGGLMIGPLVFGLFAEFGNLWRARNNNNIMQEWNGRAAANNAFFQTHPHAQKLERLSANVAAITAADKNYRLLNMAHLTAGVASAALLFLGGWYVNANMMSYGWLSLGVTALAAVARLGFWFTKGEDGNKDLAREAIAIAEGLQGVSGDKRLHYYMPQGENQWKWEFEERIKWEGSNYVNSYAAVYNGAVQQSNYISPPYNPAAVAPPMGGAQPQPSFGY